MGDFKKGVFRDNLLFCRFMCLTPALAVSTSFSESLVMGVSLILLLALSTVILHYIDKLQLENHRFVTFLIGLGAVTTLLDLAWQSIFPNLSEKFAMYFPILAVSCIALTYRDISDNNLKEKLVYTLSDGVGFLLAIGLLGFIRELIGKGTLFGVAMFGKNYTPVVGMLLPCGAFIALAMVIAIINYVKMRKR